MRSLQLTGVAEAHVAEVAEPDRGQGEVLIEVLACGLCGTDRHIYRGEYPSSLPLVMGHEFGGRIIESPTGSGWSPGEIVSVDPNISCGACTDCSAGRPALCPTRYALGVDVGGGLAERVSVPMSQLVRMSPGVDALHLAFVEPLACCLRGADLAGPLGGENVAVIGGGVIGQLVVQLAAMQGAGRITLVTRQSARRELAERLGATDSADPAAAQVGLGRQFDVVFECAGVISAFDQAQWLARRGGSIILLGIPAQDAAATVRPYDLVFNEHRIQGSFLNPLTQERAGRLISDGSLQIDPLISRVLALDEVDEVLKVEPGYGDIKYAVDPHI